jgi:hypothetical protein
MSTLAPPPDFRYVGLEVGRPASLGAWVGFLGAGAAAGAVVRGPAGVAAGVGVAAVAAIVARAAGGAERRARAKRSRMAIVPWGVVVDEGERSRILRWPGVTRVAVEAVHGVDSGTTFTRYSVVTIDTGRERFVGRAAGTVPLERLVAHLSDYAREASHLIALDLDGASSGEGPVEPDAELVLTAARGYMASSTAGKRLDLPPDSYRKRPTHTLSKRAVRELSGVLSDRTEREVDPRPFAAVLAAELGATELADDLVSLVQSPLPLLAAVAKVAARKLGVAKAKVGTLEEVEPFLLGRDVEALVAWQGAS